MYETLNEIDGLVKDSAARVGGVWPGDSVAELTELVQLAAAICEAPLGMTASQEEALRTLARQVQGRMELHTRSVEREAALVTSLALQKKQLEELEVSRKLMVDFNQSSPNLTWVKTQEGCYLSYNRAFAQHFSIGEEAWLGKTDFEVLPEPIAEGFYCHDQDVLRRREAVEERDHYRMGSGETLTFRTIRFPMRGQHDEELIAGIAINITRETNERRALTATNAQLSMLACTDELTGLANRRVFDQRMIAEYAVAENKMLPLALLVLDVDDFKWRNDRFGHAEGDAALAELGRILEANCRPGDLAARIGGEEFALLLPRTGAREAQRRAESIQRTLGRRRFASGPLTVSVGVTARDYTTTTWQHLVGRADAAMYAAKRAGKNRIAVHPQGAMDEEQTIPASQRACA